MKRNRYLAALLHTFPGLTPDYIDNQISYADFERLCRAIDRDREG